MAEHPVNQGHRMHYQNTVALAKMFRSSSSHLEGDSNQLTWNCHMGALGFLDFVHRPVL
jgi:hypothetical protein